MPIFRSLILFMLLSIVFIQLSGQHPDLIVSQDGDSIACQIEDITKTKIYYTTLWDRERLYSYIHLDSVAGLTYNYKSMGKKGNPVDFLANTALYMNLGYLYEYSTIGGYIDHLFFQLQKGPFKSFWLRAGGGQYIQPGYRGPYLTGTLQALSGKRNSHLELGIGIGGIAQNWKLYGWEVNPAFGVGYRYQSPEGGVIFRFGVSMPESLYVSFGLAF